MKQLRFIFCLLAVAAGIYFGMRGRNSRQWQGNQQDRMILPTSFDSGKVALLEVRGPQGNVTLAKGGDGWSVRERQGYPANADQVWNFVMMLEQTRVAQALAPSEKLLRETGLAEGKGVQIRLGDDAGKSLADLRFGKKMMDDLSGSPLGRYLYNGKNVLLVPNTFALVDDPLREWLEPKIVEFKAVQKMTFSTPTVVYGELSWNGGKRSFVPAGKIASGKNGKPENVQRMVDLLMRLSFQDVQPVTAGEFSWMHCLTVHCENGFEYQLFFGKEMTECRIMRVGVRAWKKEAEPTAAEMRSRLEKWEYLLPNRVCRALLFL